MTVDQVENLKSVLGKRVRLLRDYTDAPKGTIGVIDEYYGKPGDDGVMVSWELLDKQNLRDGFDNAPWIRETQFLELL